jgi:hypothetical protein
MMIDAFYFLVGVALGFSLTHFCMEFSSGFDTPIDEHADPDQIGAASPTNQQHDAATGAGD